MRDAGKTVVIVYQIPIQPFDPPIGLGLSLAHGRAVENYGLKSAEFVKAADRTTDFLEQLSRRTGAVVGARLLAAQFPLQDLAPPAARGFR